MKPAKQSKKAEEVEAEEQKRQSQHTYASTPATVHTQPYSQFPEIKTPQAEPGYVKMPATENQVNQAEDKKEED